MIGRRSFLASITGAMVASATVPLFPASPCTLAYQAVPDGKFIKIQGVSSVQFYGIRPMQERKQDIAWNNSEVATELSFALHWEP